MADKKIPDTKKRVGPRTIQPVQTGEFLPTPFRTELNKKWMDATLDRMVSKGDLEDIEAYVGSKRGRHSTPDDVYLEDTKSAELRARPQLEPAITTRDFGGDLTSAITVDDIANNIAQSFDEYNYNAAYKTQGYVYNPPINKDKFINFLSYYWITDMPVYRSTNSGTVYNPVEEAQGQLSYTFTDDNNTFEIQNQMLIKFHEGYGALDGWTYLVTGVGYNIKLVPYIDNNSRHQYPQLSLHTATISDFWDELQVTEIAYNGNIYGATHPLDLIEAYNADPNRTPRIKMYNDELNKDVYLTSDTIVRFDNTWPDVDVVEQQKVFVVTIDNITQDVGLEVIIDAYRDVDGNIRQEPVTTVSEQLQELAYRLIDTWDTDPWDAEELPSGIRDYIVVDRRDTSGTAWARTNFWTHSETMVLLEKLIPAITIEKYIAPWRQAKRPIIEFEPGMNLYNSVPNSIYEDIWAGSVDFALSVGNLPVPGGAWGWKWNGIPTIPSNSTIVYVDVNNPSLEGKIFKLHPNGQLEPVANLTEGRTTVVRNALTTELYEKWTRRDLRVVDGKLVDSHIKYNVNQEPLFDLVSDQGIRLAEYAETQFEGNKIFSYKKGTGVKDVELGFALSYKDSARGAEIVFENNIVTERESYSVKAEGITIGLRQEIPGYYYYKQNGKPVGAYKPSNYPLGATTTKSYTVVDPELDATIELGYDAWRVTKEFVVHSHHNDLFTVTEKISEGVWNNKRVSEPDLVVAKGTTYTFWDLHTDAQLKFWTLAGDNIETTPHDVTVTRISDIKLTVTIPDQEGIVLYYGYDSNRLRGRIVVLPETDSRYHSVYINNAFIPLEDYTLTSDSIVIPSNLLSENDVVEVEYYSNDRTTATDVVIPEALTHNANNVQLETFIVSETLGHWRTLIEAVPGFEGQAFGLNNYHKQPRVDATGGEIFMHDDIGVMHDACYASKDTNISAALFEQARDWTTFRRRFVSQVRRIHASKSWASTAEIVDTALEQIVATRRGYELYRDSNMVFALRDDNRQERHLLNLSTMQVVTTFPIAGERTVQDHVYVYLLEDTNQTTKLVERILVKDVDYIINGQTIDILATPAAGVNPYVVIRWAPIIEECQVPASLTKIGLANRFKPTIANGVLTAHDGLEIEISTTAELYDTQKPNYDPVAASLWELELRIDAGMVDVPGESYNAMMPNYHVNTWYDSNDINDYAFRYFTDCIARQSIESLTPEDWFSPNSTTWNYSSLGHVGYWKGAYTKIFGTHQPHITPWHMLGFTAKPTWWDTHYSWTDGTKRAALVNALRTGIVSEPGKPLHQDLTFARYTWDWANKCPVDINANLISVEQILGVPDAESRYTDFVYGDWGPVEWNWRNSAEGQAAMLDAIIKLNPTTAWTRYYQPDMLNVNPVPEQGWMLSVIDNKLTTPSNYFYTNTEYGYLLESIDVIESDAGFDANITLDVVSPGATLQPIAIPTLDDDGRITHVTIVDRGLNLTDFVQVSIVGGDVGQTARFKTKFTEKNFKANGLAALQRSYLIRNSFGTDIEQYYASIETRLLQKMGGFTSKHLLTVSTESGPQGEFDIGDSDMELFMYEGIPSEVIVACDVRITKTDSGYVVNGLSNAKQQFKFYEPLLSGTADYTTVIVNDATTLRKFRVFAAIESTAMYGTKFARIQDAYNFIRGNRQYLESKGYEFDTNKDVVALEFARWAVTAEINETYTARVSNVIKFTPVFGTVSEFNTLARGSNAILNTNGELIDAPQYDISREMDKVTIQLKDGVTSRIGSVGIATITYEHALLIANTTEFNDIIYNDVINQKHDRLYISGQRTGDWTGAKRASGYLIEDHRIVQNWDSSVKAIADYYDPSVLKFNDAVERAENLTIGNADREWARKMRLSNNSMLKFFQGAIREKGTNAIIDRLDRNDIIGLGDADISIHEEFMFRHSYYGENDAINITEIELTEEQIKTNPQVIDFTSNDLVYVNEGKGTTTFEVLPFAAFEQGERMLSAGEVLRGDVSTEVLGIDDIDALWESVQAAGVVEGWNDFTSYKKGDVVRFEGDVYRLLTESTGLNLTTDGVFVDGVITNLGTSGSYVIPYGAVGIIDNTTITFGSSTTVQGPVTAIGSVVNPTVQSPSVININGIPVNLIKTEEVLVVSNSGDPTLVGTSVFGATFEDSTGRTITLNGNTVDFTKDNKAANVVETYTADGLTAEYPVSSTIGFDGTYTWIVDEVRVGGSVINPIDYTVTTNSVIFDNEPGAPAITLATYWASTLSPLFTVTTAITNAIINGLNGIRAAYDFGADPGNVNYNLLMNALKSNSIESAVAHFLTVHGTTDGIAGSTLRIQFVSYLNEMIRRTNDHLNLNTYAIIDEADLETFSTTHTDIDLDYAAWWDTLNQTRINTVFAPLINATGTAYTPVTILIPAVTPLIEIELYAKYAMTTSAIVARINDQIPSSEKITASVNTVGNIVIVYDINPSQTGETLTLSASATNALLGFPASGQVAGAGLTTAYQHVELTLANIIDVINANVNLTTVTAANNGDNRIAITDTIGTLTFSGAAAADLGLNASYIQQPTSQPSDSNINSVVEQINAALTADGVTAVSASINSNRIVIASSNTEVFIGGDAFINYTNVETGTLTNLNQSVSNIFETEEWEVIPDPAEITIWTANDTTMLAGSTGDLTTKFNSWNVYKFQNFGLYSLTEQYDDSGDPIIDPETGSTLLARACSVCAGNLTTDGNDAQISTNIPHNLSVGDYVMILNSTTSPNIDGIHKVTRVPEGNGLTFYIDQYIDECGYCSSILVMRSVRFNSYDDLQYALTSPYWAFREGDKVWTTSDAVGVRSTNVHEIVAGTGTTRNFGSNVDTVNDPDRTVAYRVTNSTLESIAIYDGEQHATKVVLEVFDPMRGIIPGVVDREIDTQSPIDFAVYSDSTDINFEGDENNAWGLAEVGKTWWDISTVRYYDYDQGDSAYKAKNWGRLFPGSSIDIYEWTRSTVPPDEWKDAVEQGTEVAGEIPSGTAYSVYDNTINEDVYYYTEKSEWDPLLGQYTSYYYFWVKNKFTVPNNQRSFSVDTLAKVLADPTANGIAWCAAISANEMIVSNVQPFLNDDTVMQINKYRKHEAHSSWTAIKPVVDRIPGYWYVGLRDNLVGVQSGTNVRFPNMKLHKFNRYGDDRALGQGWFTDTADARRQAVELANRLLKRQNLLNVLPGIWDDTIGGTINHDGLEIDLTDFWEYTDYVSPLRDPEQVASYELSRFSEIETVDPVRIQLVKLVKSDPRTHLDVSEFYQWIDNEWVMVQKTNATIKFNDLVYTTLLNHAWDTQPWDSNAWDIDYGVVVEKIVYALRHDLFIRDYDEHFNMFFFGMVEYAISTQTQCDWVYKTTYVQLNVDTPIRTPRKYTSDNIVEITGFINTVKPYHTKIRNIYQRHHILDIGEIDMDDTRTKKDIWIQMETLDHEYTYAPGIYTATFADTEYEVDLVGSFTDEEADIEKSIISKFDEPYNYQWIKDSTNVFRRTEYGFDMGEFVSFDITTSSVNSEGTTLFDYMGVTPVADSVRHVYMQDQDSNVKVYALRDYNVGALGATFAQGDDSITLAAGDGAKFEATGGYAWIQGEVIHYGQRLGDQLLYIERQRIASYGSNDIPSGTEIVDLEGGMIDTFRGLDIHPGRADWGGWNTTNWQADNWGAVEHYSLFWSPVRMDTKDMSILDPANDYTDVQQIQGQ